MDVGLSRGQTTYHSSEAGQGRLLWVTSSVSSDSEMLGFLFHKGERKEDGSPLTWNPAEVAALAADSPTPLLRLPPTRAHPAPFQYQHLHVQNASRHWLYKSGLLPLQSPETLYAPAPTPRRREGTTLPPLASKKGSLLSSLSLQAERGWGEQRKNFLLMFSLPRSRKREP